VIEEIATIAENRLARPELFCWRTAVGGETDLLVKNGRGIVPIEIKAGTSVDSHAIAGLKGCMRDLSLKHGWVVYTGDRAVSLGKGIDVVPWNMVIDGKVNLFS
jgi:predicted AAA+ superfamily ATPase